MKTPAKIVREFGPFPNVENVAGVTFDGTQVWCATGDRIEGIDPRSGESTRSIDVPAHAGTAFDGEHLYQISEGRILRIEPASGRVISSIPAPGDSNSGLAWAEGTLWVGQYRDRKIHQVDPATGAILRTLESNRFVTGVTWVDGDLWHGTWEDEQSEIRRIDAKSAEVLEALEMPPGLIVAGLESDGANGFYCGGGTSRKVRVVERPTRGGKKATPR